MYDQTAVFSHVRPHQWLRELLDRGRGAVFALRSPRWMRVMCPTRCRFRFLRRLSVFRSGRVTFPGRFARGRGGGSVEGRIGCNVGQLAQVDSASLFTSTADRGRVRVEAGIHQEYDAHVPVATSPGMPASCHTDGHRKSWMVS